MLTKEKFVEKILPLIIFLLPWQTRWIFSSQFIGGEISQYGQLSVYATEILILLVVFLRGRWQPIEGMKWIKQAGYFLLGSAFISLSFSFFFSAGLAQIFHIIFAFALFTLLCDVRTNFQYIIIAFLVGLILPAILGWWQVFSGSSPASSLFGLSFQDAQVAGTAVVETESVRKLRAYGSFPHPNIFGGYLAVGIVFLAWLARMIKTKLQLQITFIPVLILVYTIVITFSRSAWIALAAGLVVLSGLMIFRRKIIPQHIVYIIVAGLFSLFFAVVLYYPQLFARFDLDLRLERFSIEERASQFSWFDDVFKHNPLFGVGPGAYAFALNAIDPGEKVWDYQPIHNIFLLMLGEIGVVGFAAFVYLILRVDQISSRVSKTAGGIFGLTLGVVLIMLGMFDHYLWSLWPGLALGAVGISTIIQWSIGGQNNNG